MFINISQVHIIIINTCILNTYIMVLGMAPVPVPVYDNNPLSLPVPVSVPVSIHVPVHVLVAFHVSGLVATPLFPRFIF